MLLLDDLPAETRRVFLHLAKNKFMTSFTLIGGTALSLQIGHRRSEDLDFWVPDECMPRGAVDAVVNMAQAAGFNVCLATSNEAISSTKINFGINLLDYARDYTIEGVKVTFFSKRDPAYCNFDTFPRLKDTGTTFQIMGQEGIFAMKSHVIYQRVRSRDLFDLKTFIQNGKELKDIFSAAIASDINCTPERAKSVLLGQIPLDANDEGFDSIGVKETIENIYEFFGNAINAHEQQMQSVIRDKVFVAKRLNTLPQLQHRAGATLTFWEKATAAIAAQGADAVDWADVERATIVEAIGENGQEPPSVTAALCEHSPGAVTPARQGEIRALVDRLAPELQARYEHARNGKDKSLDTPKIGTE